MHKDPCIACELNPAGTKWMHPSYAAGTNTKDYIKAKLKLTFAKDIWWTGLNLIGESQADLIPVVSLSHPWDS